MVTELVQTKIAEMNAFTLYELEDNILLFDYKSDIIISLDDAKSAFTLYEKHSAGNTLKVLIAFGQFSSISSEARRYSEDKSMSTPAQAIIIHNLAQRMIAKFYRMFRKDDHPLKFFGDIDEAVDWLKEV
jgi:hypothetical protein